MARYDASLKGKHEADRKSGRADQRDHLAGEAQVSGTARGAG